MITEAERSIGYIPSHILRQAELFRPLIGQGLGVLSAGYGELPDGGRGLTVAIEEGMPDEYKGIIASVVPDGIVNFLELSQDDAKAHTEDLLARAEYESRRAYHNTGFGRTTFIDTPMSVATPDEKDKISRIGSKM